MEYLNIIIQWNLRILELPAHLEQTVGQVEEVVPVWVEGVQYCFYLYAKFQVLEDYSGCPFYLLGIWRLEKLSEHLRLIANGCQLVKEAIQLTNRESGSGTTKIFHHVIHANGEVTYSNSSLVIIWIFIVVKSVVFLAI